jgi:hypothetical protein
MSLNGRLLIRLVEEHAGSSAASSLVANLIELYTKGGNYDIEDNPINQV